MILCIMGAKTNCQFNYTGCCQAKPKPESIPCLGTVCMAIVNKTSGK